jgi:hypothetical protein
MSIDPPPVVARWLKQLVRLAGRSLIPRLTDIVEAIERIRAVMGDMLRRERRAPSPSVSNRRDRELKRSGSWI